MDAHVVRVKGGDASQIQPRVALKHDYVRIIEKENRNVEEGFARPRARGIGYSGARRVRPRAYARAPCGSPTPNGCASADFRASANGGNSANDRGASANGCANQSADGCTHRSSTDRRAYGRARQVRDRADWSI